MLCTHQPLLFVAPELLVSFIPEQIGHWKSLTGAELNSLTWIRLWQHTQWLTKALYKLLYETSLQNPKWLWLYVNMSQFWMCLDFPSPNLTLKMCFRLCGHWQWDPRTRPKLWPHTLQQLSNDCRQARPLKGAVRQKVRVITSQTINRSKVRNWLIVFQSELILLCGSDCSHMWNQDRTRIEVPLSQ